MSTVNTNILPDIQANALQRLLSYIFPIRILKTKGEGKKPLKLILYKGQTQLAYGNVYYSDGLDYFPFRKAFHHLGNAVNAFQHILVLGSGIGSIAMVLNDMYPQQRKCYQFVDIDSTILALCKANLKNYSNVMGKYALQDAIMFMHTTQVPYDCICVDVFNEHIVPKQILQEGFINRVFEQLVIGGYVILNLMFQGDVQKMGFESILQRHDPDFKAINTRNNIIYIAQKH